MSESPGAPEPPPLTQLPERTFGELVALLQDLDAELEGVYPAGTLYALWAGGGFAVGYLLDDRLTRDVDSLRKLPGEVADAARRVAARRGVLSSWLNDQLAEVIEADVASDRFIEAYRGRHLVVYTCDATTLLAMKLMAGREQDQVDLRRLAEATGRVSVEAMMDAWDDLYGSRPENLTHRPWAEGNAAQVVIALSDDESQNDLD